MRRPPLMIKALGAMLFIFILFLPATPMAADYPLSFTDSSGRKLTLEKVPERVVSLVPSITEILLRIGASDRVVGITHHSVLPPESSGKEVVGGFLSPDMERVAALNPDVIFHAGMHREALAGFMGRAVLIHLSAGSIAEGMERIRLIGRIFGKEEQAARIIAEEKRQLRVTAAKVATVPAERRLRVMRIMGRHSIMAPGDDSFQNEYIRAAGGIAPSFSRSGDMIRITLDEWRGFNPQIIYGCNDDRGLLQLLMRPGWREVDAVRNRKIIFFPCELTCRVATHPGYFVSWLAARIYEDEFHAQGNTVLSESVVQKRPLPLSLPYVLRAEMVESDIMDFRNRTLVITFRGPMKALSTLEGQRKGITTIGNHYFPPPSWGLGHRQGLDALRKKTLDVLGLAPRSTAMLFTGADMKNLAVVERSFKETRVVALVTAGVMSNSVRMSADTGGFYEPGRTEGDPGTVNILILTNRRLTPRAMTRAIVSATEAKTAALQDMDIRSSQSPLWNQATGTGTDNVIVVEGAGPTVDSSGGHTKMGELIARAVYQGVRRAVHLQNGLVAERSVFQRLRERGIRLDDACSRYLPGDDSATLCMEVERILLEPRYAGFVKALMSISDGYESGLVENTESVDLWADQIAAEIAGREVALKGPVAEGVPYILGKGLEAVYAGALARLERTNTGTDGARR